MPGSGTAPVGSGVPPLQVTPNSGRGVPVAVLLEEEAQPSVPRAVQGELRAPHRDDHGRRQVLARAT